MCICTYEEPAAVRYACADASLRPCALSSPTISLSVSNGSPESDENTGTGDSSESPFFMKGLNNEHTVSNACQSKLPEWPNVPAMSSAPVTYNKER